MDKIKEAFIREYFDVSRLTKDIIRMFATEQALKDLDYVLVRSSPFGDYELYQSLLIPDTLIFIDKKEYKKSGHVYIKTENMKFHRESK